MLCGKRLGTLCRGNGKNIPGLLKKEAILPQCDHHRKDYVTQCDTYAIGKVLSSGRHVRKAGLKIGLFEKAQNSRKRNQ